MAKPEWSSGGTQFGSEETIHRCSATLLWLMPPVEADALARQQPAHEVGQRRPAAAQHQRDDRQVARIGARLIAAFQD